MRVLFVALLLVCFGCEHGQGDAPDEAAEFETKVLNGVSTNAGEASAIDSAPESLQFVCNNAPEGAYRRGRIIAEYSPNYVIKLFGRPDSLTRAVFMEEAAIEKVLGEYTLDKHQRSNDLDVYTFNSIVDNAKITVSLKHGTGMAQTDLMTGMHTQAKSVKLVCVGKGE